MTETTGSAPAVVTPGQADWEARRDSSFARAGLPAGDQFVSWHRLSAEEQADSEAGAQAALKRGVCPHGDLAAEVDKHRTRLAMLLADTPFEFRPDWAPEYEGVDVGDMLVSIPQEAEETPGYWQVRTALTAATHALQLVKLGTDGKLAAMAGETLAKVDAVLEGPGDPSGRRLARSEDAEAGEIHPIGYQGAAQHTFTTACDGFHEPGQCPTSERPTRHVVGDDDDPWAEANAAGAL